MASLTSGNLTFVLYLQLAPNLALHMQATICVCAEVEERIYHVSKPADAQQLMVSCSRSYCCSAKANHVESGPAEVEFLRLLRLTASRTPAFIAPTDRIVAPGEGSIHGATVLPLDIIVAQVDSLLPIGPWVNTSTSLHFT